MVKEGMLVNGLTISLTQEQDKLIRAYSKKMNRSYSYVLRSIINQWTKIKGIK
jgi:hypothetical protein